MRCCKIFSMLSFHITVFVLKFLFQLRNEVNKLDEKLGVTENLLEQKVR